MHSKTKSKPNTKRTSKRASQSRVEFQYVEDNTDEQTDKRTTQQQSFQTSSSSHLKTASTINITTDIDESADDEQEGNDFNTLKSGVGIMPQSHTTAKPNATNAIVKYHAKIIQQLVYVGICIVA